MYKLIQLLDGNFRVELDYDRVTRMSDSEFSTYFAAGRYTRRTFMMLQKIKEIQALDNAVSSKKRKINHIS